MRCRYQGIFQHCPVSLLHEIYILDLFCMALAKTNKVKLFSALSEIVNLRRHDMQKHRNADVTGNIYQKHVCIFKCWRKSIHIVFPKTLQTWKDMEKVSRWCLEIQKIRVYIKCRIIKDKRNQYSITWDAILAGKFYLNHMLLFANSLRQSMKIYCYWNFV